MGDLIRVVQYSRLKKVIYNICLAIFLLKKQRSLKIKSMILPRFLLSFKNGLKMIFEVLFRTNISSALYGIKDFWLIDRSWKRHPIMAS